LALAVEAVYLPSQSASPLRLEVVAEVLVLEVVSMAAGVLLGVLEWRLQEAVQVVLAEQLRKIAGHLPEVLRGCSAPSAPSSLLEDLLGASEVVV